LNLHRLIDYLPVHRHGYLTEQFFHMFRHYPDAAMTAVTVDRSRSGRAVNEYPREGGSHGISAEWILWSRRDGLQNLFTIFLHLFLNRWRDPPGRVLFLVCYLEFADWCTPDRAFLLFRDPESNGIYRAYSTVAEKIEASVGDVHDNSVAYRFGNDSAVVVTDLLIGSERGIRFQPVHSGEVSQADTKFRGDKPERFLLLGNVDPVSSDDPVRSSCFLEIVV